MATVCPAVQRVGYFPSSVLSPKWDFVARSAVLKCTVTPSAEGATMFSLAQETAAIADTAMNSNAFEIFFMIADG